MSFINTTQLTSLASLFRERVNLSSDSVAYRHYDLASQSWVDTRWGDIAKEVGRWQAALQRSGVQAGDRVGLMLKNSREWVIFDQAALGLGLVTVPLYVEDRAENAAYVCRDASVRMLLVDGKAQWQSLLATDGSLPSVERILSIEPIAAEDAPGDARLTSVADWLFGADGALQTLDTDPDELATIVYTSGTTGNPKGVMLSHRNILHNAWYSAKAVHPRADDVFLSFLPLSHMFERTVGYYLAIMAGITVAFSRSIPQLSEDMLQVRPTALVSVPRIYERVYARVQEKLSHQAWWQRTLFALTLRAGWRQHCYQQGEIRLPSLLWPLLSRIVASKITRNLGGRIRLAVCGGAPLSDEIGRFFLSLGVPMIQGYGLTEASPVVAVNRPLRNRLGSIGLPLDEVDMRIGEDGELQTKSACLMSGYWHNPDATAAIFTADGWLRTGDIARVDKDGYWFITGRLKDILVLSNGEKVPPADMETAIALDPLFEQVLVVGDNRPCLTALIVLEATAWQRMAQDHGLLPTDPGALHNQQVHARVLTRVAAAIDHFPGYARIKAVHLLLEPWTVDAGLLTPTLKLKRAALLEKYRTEIDELYQNKSAVAND